MGGISLNLFSTLDETRNVWTKDLANTVKYAKFSYDSAFIATTGEHDRLVKIWRRLAFGSDDTCFDFTYLPHPRTVTNIYWRKPHHVDQTIENVLYTLCTDNKLRIWATSGPHDLQILHLWGQIDLGESIKPRAPLGTGPSAERYAFIIDGRDFTAATEHSVQSRTSSDVQSDPALAHLIEVANRNPEICVVLDTQGYMSAWGIENIGSKPRQKTDIFNIAHVDGVKLRLPSTATDNFNFAQIHSFCNKSNGNLNILVHHFNGSIEVFESNVADLFDPCQRRDRIVPIAMWSGHSAAIKKIVRNISGLSVVSRTDGNECVVWKHAQLEGTSVLRQSTITGRNHIRRMCVLSDGHLVIFLHHDSIELWDTSAAKGVQLASCSFSVTGKPLCLLTLPEVREASSVVHIATVTSAGSGIVWEITSPNKTSFSTKSDEYKGPSIQEFCRFQLGEPGDLAYVLPVDPAGSPPVISGFLDTFARDIAISYTNSGTLRSWTARVDLGSKRVDWLQTCSVDTGIAEPALASGSSMRKAALVNSRRDKLTIWDVRGSQLEFDQDYEALENIQDLDWTSTPDDQSILAVGFPYRVVLLAQMRYDYINKGPAWAPIREINIRDLTPHPIGDSTWLSGGNLIIGAGNQLFVYDKDVDESAPVLTSLGKPYGKDTWDLFEVVSRLNGPLPLYHPQFLRQLILTGKNILVQRILLALHKALKFFVEGDILDSYLGLDLEQFYNNSEVCRGKYYVDFFG